MADAKMIQAKQVYQTLCKALDDNDWHYKKDDEKLKVECGARGDDLPMDLTIHVDADRQLIMLISHLPFVIAEDKRLDVAVAVSYINNMLVDGCFDYDVTSGHLFFRMTNSFIESQIHAAVCMYLIYCACQTIDEYNDKLLMVGKGMLSIEQFIESCNKD